MLGVALDVTEQHEALDALREASERAALITRHAGIGTWEADFRRARRALGRADVPPARPAGLATTRPTAPSAWRWSTPTTCRS